MNELAEPLEDRPYRVLIIEDDEEVARLMCLSLERDGLTCHTASDGFGGLRAFTEKKPHLVLLDWMLPGMSGQEVLETLRAKSNVPILVVSALADESMTTSFPGANGQIGKPFNPMRLIRRIRDELHLHYEQ